MTSGVPDSLFFFYESFMPIHEIVGMNFEESQIAEIANRLYASAMAYA